jgi:UDPglucose 6-dehydrogenase
MSLLLVGYGFVGKAVHNAFKDKLNLVIVDPKYTENKIKDFTDYVGAIVCVPTPPANDGSCDTSYIMQVLSDVPEKVPVMLKSTISLEGWTKIKEQFSNHSITFNPEFLTAKTANEDFLNQKTIYLGGGNVEFWAEVYATVFPYTSIKVGTVEELILTKYVRNSFLATKVAFFNQIFDFCEKSGIDFDTVRQYATDDERITKSHSFVFENDRGFGGACFPKDTAALLKTAEHFKAELAILAEAVEYNKKIRSNYENTINRS